MDEYVHVVIHHGFFSEGDNESSYGGSVAKVKCDVDKWGYFEVLWIVKELGYEESGTVIYKDPKVGLFTLSDDKGDQEMVDLCKVHKSVHLYVQHSVSQPDYYDGPIEDEIDISKVIINVDETEDVIGKLVEDVLNGKADGVEDINVDVNGAENMIEGEVGDNNVDVNGAQDMGEVEDNNVDVNEAEDMSDSDDVSFQYDSVLDVAFQDSDEDNDDLVEKGITHLLAMTRRKKGPNFKITDQKATVHQLRGSLAFLGGLRLKKSLSMMLYKALGVKIQGTRKQF
ncbi:hypothetical protein KIW84_070401 [Lathyrus oleraceus]|uniref:PB1-like domain-containing protein n=1 Tax=Pisum sativum TaxID=3888 RepID=A0A9D4VFM7_PEA|nr:hypothetical protein KIW84_070401 [Pisum sativum]